LPRKIGVVTSIDGAAIRDIITVVRRRHANAQIVIRPTRVQGEGAAAEIARGIRALAQVDQVDVIIVGRGGGSLEDLWAFNEEVVARAIADCPIPIISAVGHETDFTIADFVADLRAPTPSAAAEIVVKAWDALSTNVTQLGRRLRSAIGGALLERRRVVHGIERRPAFGGIPTNVAMRSRHASELTHAMGDALRRILDITVRRAEHSERRLELFHPGRRVSGLHRQIESATARLHAAASRTQQQARTALQTNASRLDALSPLAVLGRGYAVCWNVDRTQIIKHSSQTAVGDTVRVTLADGELECDVRNRTT
jgi:exodeoxyribonuclease VII large subunit